MVRLSDEERERIFDGAAEAKLIALACSKPPKGRKRWTLQLLEEQVVELKIVARASDNTIGRTVAVGTGLPRPPRADPGVRLSRTGLLPEVERDRGSGLWRPM